MKRLMLVALLLAPSLAFGQGSEIDFKPAPPALAIAELTPGVSTIAGCTNQFVIADGSSLINCATAFTVDASGAGNWVISMRKTFSSESVGPFNIDGTMPAAQPTHAVFVRGTPADGTSIPRLFETVLAAGYTGANGTALFWGAHQTAGTNTSITSGGNAGVDLQTTATTAGTNIGLRGVSQGGDFNVGVVGRSGAAKASAPNVGVYGIGLNTTSNIHAGGYFALATANPTFASTESAAVVADNAAVSASILLARDNGATVPTTGATATWRIADGAWPQVGNGVLTNATMTPEVQGRGSGGLIHSYTWTNAQVAALSGTAGDITVATLPAKTQVKNAYVVITGQAAGPTTVTVSCGDAIGGTPFINYTVALDAKVAANTVYGDAVAERGTSLDVEFYYLPSYTATTLVTCHFISTGANLSTVTGSTGRVILETALLP